MSVLRRILFFSDEDDGNSGGLVTIVGKIVSFIASKVTPIKELKVAIEPVQSGSGDPSPTNVRPITGWTGANINVSGADTSNPTVYPISWQTEAGTVYGGTLDVTTGVLTVEKEYIEITGNDLASLSTASHESGCTVAYAGEIHTMRIVQQGTLCDSLKTGSYGSGTLPANSIAFGRSNSRIYLCIEQSLVGTTLDSFKSYLNSHPIHAVYILKTPVEYTLTSEEISTLIGENNIWADCGDVTVTAVGIKEITPSSAQALNMLLGGMYTNNHTAEDVSDDEALDIILGGSNA